ncbi:MAG: dihydropteroate synthase [Cyclobacteriaceae bacterium]
MKLHQTLNIKGNLYELNEPKVMGVINVTPDSFYASSRQSNIDHILTVADKMIEDGASFVDLGGYSSRPGAKDISIDEELARVIPPIEAINREFPELIVSIDTFRSRVADESVSAGASIINDISAGALDDLMIDVVAKHHVPYIIMHMKGTPQNMVKKAEYDDLVKDVVFALSSKIELLAEKGIPDIIVDPGFGFAKNIEQNFELLSKLEVLSTLERPLLVGLSRKSMIYKTLNIEPEQALNGTTVVNTLALLKGASILRVHDVKEAVEVVKLVNKLNL